MNRFKIDEKVVALSSTPAAYINRCQPRVKDEVYAVIDSMFCPVCGIQLINVSDSPTQAEFVLCSCSQVKMNTKGVHWTDSKHFAPIDEALSHALEEENYEYACKLRDA
jgi:hypothetical protein